MLKIKIIDKDQLKASVSLILSHLSNFRSREMFFWKNINEHSCYFNKKIHRKSIKTLIQHNQTIEFKRRKMKKMCKNFVLMIIKNQKICQFKNKHIFIWHSIMCFEIVIVRSKICEFEQINSIIFVCLKNRSMNRQILSCCYFDFDENNMKRKWHEKISIFVLHCS